VVDRGCWKNDQFIEKRIYSGLSVSNCRTGGNFVKRHYNKLFTIFGKPSAHMQNPLTKCYSFKKKASPQGLVLLSRFNETALDGETLMKT
jgi:hypothetical protein